MGQLAGFSLDWLPVTGLLQIGHLSSEPDFSHCSRQSAWKMCRSSQFNSDTYESGLKLSMQITHISDCFALFDRPENDFFSRFIFAITVSANLNLDLISRSRAAACDLPMQTIKQTRPQKMKQTSVVTRKSRTS